MSKSKAFSRQGWARPARRPTVSGGIEQLEGRRLLSAATAFVPGELLVSFQAGVSPAEITRVYAQHGIAERKALDGPARENGRRLKLVSVPAARTTALIPVLERDARVAYAEPNYLVPAATTPNDPTYVRDWGLTNNGFTGGTTDADIDADEAWDIATGGGDIVVAVIDTGVDYTHPDLAANMWHNPGEVEGNGIDDDGNGFVDDYYGYDFANDDGDPIDDLGHGTHVAGTIGMAGNNGVGSAGVNWNARIMALKTDGGPGSSVADLIDAYNYLVMMRGRGVDVRVTNNSYGTFEFGSFSQAWEQAIDAMGQAGILFVAAAGNEARTTEIETHYPSGFGSPSIIAVAATDHDDRYASFTNWGATGVDLAAPGESVWSTQPGNTYSWGSGTSMATPHVAGAAALVWSAFPNLSAAEVKARLLNGADPIGAIGANASYPTLTNGRLNVRNALLVPPADNESIAPSAVGNLAVSVSSPWSTTLRWTASGDDGATGRAGYYDVRYSTAPITAATWAAANPALSEPAPRQAGSAETLVVSGLEPRTAYYFAMKVTDNAGNESALSNMAQGVTSAAAVRFNDDMESSSANWVATDLWHRSSLRAHDSATAWYFGQETSRTYFTGAQHSGAITLASPVDLRGVTQAQLRFREWRQVIDSTPLDVARVEVSRDGNDWTSLSDSFFSSYDWQQRTMDLTPFVGGPLHIRFKFDTNAFDFLPFAIAQGFEGWYVDDVQVLVPAAQPAGLSVNDVTVTEGNDGTRHAVFTVIRSGGGGPASVRYATADGSATAAGDYQAASGILTFAPGENRRTVSVPIHGDRLAEADESFVLNLSNPTGAVIADPQGKASILDDEPRIHLTTVVVFPEGNERQTILVAANLSVPSSQTVTVNYTTADGTATAGSDYRAQSGTLTFNPGETRKTIGITLPKDRQPEAIVEAFFVNLSNASSNAAILRRGNISIVDDDPPQAHGGGGGGQSPAGLAFADGHVTGTFAGKRVLDSRAGDSIWDERLARFAADFDDLALLALPSPPAN